MIYQFNCEVCGEIYLNLKMSDIPLKECPDCGCKNIERSFAPTISLWKCDGAYSKQNHGKDNN